MKIFKFIIPIAALLLVLNFACSSSDDDDDTTDSRYPTSRNIVSGTTDSLGSVLLDLNSHRVSVSVEDTTGSELEDIEVTAYLLKDYLFVFASDPSNDNYPNFSLTPYSSITAKPSGNFLPRPAAVNSPQELQFVEMDVALILNPVEQDFYPFASDPLYLAALLSDDWITLHSAEGLLSSVYTLADSIPVDGGLLIHLASSVADTTGSDYQTAVASMDLVSNYNDFASLMGLVFNITGTDSLTYNYVSYGDSLLPVIYISDISLHRGTFWAQFTLTWGENPRDLDSHLWTPSIEDSIYHIYYPSANRGDTNSAPYADLDYDDVTSFGPEHVTIHQAFAGTYTFAVYHYSGDSTIASSGAQVKIFEPDGGIRNFTVPTDSAGAYWWWHVCTIDGTSGDITVIDSLAANPPYSYSVPGNIYEKNPEIE